MTLLCVSFHELRPTEGHLTGRALVGLLPGVRPLVSLQNPRAFEAFVARGTSVRLLPRVRPRVRREVVRLHEALAALPALERPLPGVVASVYLQLRRRPEALAAPGARVRPLRRVRPVVSRQGTGAAEQFAAAGARVAHAGVQLGHVQVQAPLERVRLPAVFAAEALLRGAAVATQPVGPQGAVGPAAFPAVPAEERRLVGVRPVVQRQRRRVAERFGALGAREGEVARVEPLVPGQTSQVGVAAVARGAGEGSPEVVHVGVMLVEVYETFEALPALGARARLVSQVVRFKPRRVGERPAALDTTQCGVGGVVPRLESLRLPAAPIPPARFLALLWLGISLPVSRRIRNLFRIHPTFLSASPDVRRRGSESPGDVPSLRVSSVSFRARLRLGAGPPSDSTRAPLVPLEVVLELEALLAPRASERPLARVAPLMPPHVCRAAVRLAARGACLAGWRDSRIPLRRLIFGRR